MVGNHAYASPGAFVIRVTVNGLASARDVGGSTATAQTLASVARPVLPPLAIGGRTRGVAGRVLVFNSAWGASFPATWRVRRPGGKGKVVARDFGPRFRFRPREAGTHVLALTVTSLDGGTAQVVTAVIRVGKKKGLRR